ncbi:MAG: acetyl-CoA C-acyltransferase [Saccharofermentans sp.]|nr:acetyl-CoA C-acyltransferase [Saccharofermentans sp.]
MDNVYLLNAKRTAIGKFLGSFYENDPCDVSSQVIVELLKGINPSDVDITIIGNVISANMGQAFFRKIAINAGIPVEKPAYSVNMVCGSGMMAVINAVKEIRCGSNLVVAGGVEFMSNIPYATNTYLRLGKKFGSFEMTDLMVSDGLTDAFSGVHMGVTAENIANRIGVTREEQDNYSWEALQRAIKAVDSGDFKDEIVPVLIKDYKGRESFFDTDEYPNRTSTPEKIALLTPTFIKDGTGTVTAASASGINDGAAYVTVASESYIKKNDCKPLARIAGYTAVGLDPQVMGLGPYYAITKLLYDNDLTIDDIDVFEINEAFAAQVLGSMKLLSKEFGNAIEDIIEKTNIHGSGLGLGHPLGATGARIITTLAYIMQKKNLKRGVATLCIGGGQGTAVLLERD